MTNVLLIGETWTTYSVHIKGRSSFVLPSAGEGASHLVRILRESGDTVTHLANEGVAENFPGTSRELSAFDVIALSDVGALSLILDERVLQGIRSIDRLDLIAEYVKAGGGLIMVGGYMSFGGFGGQAGYGRTPVAEVLPVEISDIDDRRECPAGVTPQTVSPGHAALGGATGSWPYLLGYNRVVVKPGATVVATVHEDPLLVTWEVGSGRAVAYTSDLAPHWASQEFMASDALPALWKGLVSWAGGTDR